MAKLLSLLAFIPIAFWLIRSAVHRRDGRHLFDCLLATTAFIGPFVLFEVWKVLVLGPHLYWLNMMEFLTFFRSQSTASNVGLRNIAAVVTNALNTYSNNSAVMQQRFGYSPLTLLLVAALTVGLVCRYADSQFIKLFCLLSVTAALIEISWWLFISNGWPRYALIGLFLYFLLSHV